MGLPLDYLVKQVVPEVMTENYLLVVANPKLSDALAEAMLDAMPDDMREDALDFMDRLHEARL